MRDPKLAVGLPRTRASSTHALDTVNSKLRRGRLRRRGLPQRRAHTNRSRCIVVGGLCCARQGETELLATCEVVVTASGLFRSDRLSATLNFVVAVFLGCIFDNGGRH